MTRTNLKYSLIGVGLWLAAILGFAFNSVQTTERRLTDELEATGRTLQRLISQRVAQHDAHMTSLIALTSGVEPAPFGAVRHVMETITRFYPRIAWIELVSLGDSAADDQGLKVLLEVPKGKSVDISPLRGSLAQQVRGKITVYENRKGQYLLAKRALMPSKTAVVLSIDARLLIEPEEQPAWAHVRLILGGKPLLDLPARGRIDTGTSFVAPLHFDATIDGENQQLSVLIERQVPLAILFSGKPFFGFSATTGLALFAVMFALRQRSTTLGLQRAMAEAEARAVLHERETLLVHASRVNAMGEMASGIAHELTQPLTAILSRSQAALRLADADVADIKRISIALEVNIREAKRAGELLKRMRDYASKKVPKPVENSLNEIVTEIVALTSIDLKQRGILLDCRLTPQPLKAVADAIELQQVLHNLIRNAADALEGTDSEAAIIRIETRAAANEARIIVSDNGPGIVPDTLPKLFHPFFTTKPEGMGLGLSLCATLVERIGGKIAAENSVSGGASFTITLPCITKSEVL
ncbi:sensor histidine kinase [Agrobacterium deltaense]|uniref:sensor histidine kinase n=1 Tax=Agrobacterium deltaense TaxID=1183412 RepID=UPI003D957018